VFVDPSKQFNKENEELTKMHIDNSLELGWEVKDIIVATNFPWEYRGVKTYIVPDECFYGKNNFYRSTKIPVIKQLFKDGFVNELFWFHDNDAFQLIPFDEKSIVDEMDGAVMGITDHGWCKKWNAGSFFFTPESEIIFTVTLEWMNYKNIDEQDALQDLIDTGKVYRTRNLNITYNFSIYYHVYTIPKMRKPMLVAHFHPHKQRHLNLYTPLIPERLIKLFKNYGLEATN